jgi:hypothetical protein
MVATATDIYASPEFKRLIDLVNNLYELRVGMTEYDKERSRLLLHTDSGINGLNVLEFRLNPDNITDSLAYHVKRLESKPEEAKLYVKRSMLREWIRNYPQFEFTENYERLLLLVADEKCSIKDFNKAMMRESGYRGRFKVMVQKVLQPIYRVKGKKKKRIEEGDFIEVPEPQIIPVPVLDKRKNPITSRKELVEKSLEGSFEKEEDVEKPEPLY